VEHERVVGRDNVVSAEHLPLQLAKQPGRAARVLACACSSGAISTVSIRSGTAPAALVAMTIGAARSPCGLDIAVHPSGHFTVSNSCAQVTNQQHRPDARSGSPSQQQPS